MLELDAEHAPLAPGLCRALQQALPEWAQDGRKEHTRMAVHADHETGPGSVEEVLPRHTLRRAEGSPLVGLVDLLGEGAQLVLHAHHVLFR